MTRARLGRGRGARRGDGDRPLPRRHLGGDAPGRGPARRHLPARDPGGEPERRGGARGARRRGAERQRLHDRRRGRGRDLHDVLDLDAGVAPGGRGRRRAGAVGEHRGVAGRRGSPRWRSGTGSGGCCERRLETAVPLRRARPGWRRPARRRGDGRLRAARGPAAALLRGVEGFGAKRDGADGQALVAVGRRAARRGGGGGGADDRGAGRGGARDRGGGLDWESMWSGRCDGAPPAHPPLRQLGWVCRWAGLRGMGGGMWCRATVWGPRSGSGSPHLAAVDALHRHGADCATVLLGVDGVLDGERRRARFVAANRGVPAITVAVGERAAIDAACAEVVGAAHLVTSRPWRLPQASTRKAPRRGSAAEGTRVTLVTSEIARSGDHALYLELIHALRRDGASGATALRGVWGFRGDVAPHGDRVLALRRDVPLLVETVDSAGARRASGSRSPRRSRAPRTSSTPSEVSGSLTLD